MAHKSNKVEIKNPAFLRASGRLKECPPGNLPDFALIGRSNVGKSSLINMLCGRRALAKTSSNPGKTRSINHFLMDDRWHLVDLPGYGYARVSKDERERFEGFITEYILERDQLVLVFVLIDSRIPPQKIDIEFINWLGEKHVPFSIIFTKTDKHKNAKQLEANIGAVLQELSIYWENLPPYFLSSAETGNGKKEILGYIGKVLTDLKK